MFNKKFVNIGFRALTGLRGKLTIMGENSSVETTRLARTELVMISHLLQANLCGRQGLTLFGSTILLCVAHSNIHHARVKANPVIEIAVQCTSLITYWCEVLLLHKSEYLNKDTKKRKMSR